MSAIGMDVSAMRHLADDFERTAKEINGVVFRVNGNVNTGIVEWLGEAAREYSNSWSLRSKVRLLAIEVELLLLAKRLRSEIEDQTRTSNASPSTFGAGRWHGRGSATYDDGRLRITDGASFRGNGPRTVSDLLDPLHNDDKLGHSADPHSVYHYPGGIAVSIMGDPPNRHVIVTISGTRDLGFGGTDIDDMSTNLQNAAGAYTAKEHAIEEAMLRAGVTSDDKVMLVGHSMGGADAIAFASDHADDHRFKVVSIVTVDAPPTPKDPPRGVNLLALEGSRDPVLRLGFEPGDRGVDASAVSIPEPLMSSPLTNHDPAFLQGRISESNPSVALFEYQNREFFTGDESSTQMYANERVSGNAWVQAATHPHIPPLNPLGLGGPISSVL